MAYIGQGLTEGQRTAYNYVASAGQTVFAATYTKGFIDVYQNGVLLTPTDYTATNGTTVVFNVGANLNDEITIHSHNIFSVADTVSASAGGTFNNNVAIAGTLTMTGSILPSADVTYDLGSASNRFRDLYLSGTTIDLGGASISYDSGTNTFNFTTPGSTPATVNLGNNNTDDLAEGTTNLYYTDTRVGTYLSNNGFDTATNIVASITDSAPATLDTLNELAAALGDDPNFATTVTNSIATKLPLSGGTMTGNLSVQGTVTADGLTVTGNVVASKLVDAQNNGYEVDPAGDSFLNNGTFDGYLQVLGLTELSNDFTVYSNATVTGDVTIGDRIIHRFDTNTAIRFPAADTVSVETAGSERLRIDASGNVGINRTNPLAALDVGADGEGEGLIAQLTRFTPGPGIHGLYISANVTDPYVKLASTGSSSGGFRFDSGNAERMRITPAGNVGIGTTSPAVKLDVSGSPLAPATSGTSQAGSLRLSQTLGSGVLDMGFFTSSNGTAWLQSTSKTDLATNYDIALNPNGGNVGVGLTQPFMKLDVSGGAYFTGFNNPTGSGRAGLEIGYDGNQSLLQSYDRTNNTFKPLTLNTSNVVTTQSSSNISYRATAQGSANSPWPVYEAPGTVIKAGDAGGVAWQDMRAFIAHKSGSVRIRAGMNNQSGTYYFVFRVVEVETGNVVFTAGDGNGGYTAYEFPAGQAGNVHNYKYYEWVTPNLIAGFRYVIQMANSDINGNTVYSHPQNLYLGELTVWSQSPGETYGAPLKIFQEVGQTALDVNYDYIREGLSNAPQTQNFRGTEETFLGWFIFRAGARYLDVKTNLYSDGFMFFFRAHGYLYNDGLFNSAMAGGYMYINNSVIVQQYSTPSGSRGFSSLYRSSDGFLCAKLDKVATGYTEGVIGLFFGAHGPAPADIRVTRYVQNNNAGNYYA